MKKTLRLAHMSTRHGGAGDGQGGGQPPAKRRRNRREVAGGGGAGQQDEAAAAGAGGELPRYFDCLSEDLIGDVLSFLGVRCLDSACHVCKAVSQVAMRLMPLWIGVAASAGEDSADGGATAKCLPAHVKPTLRGAGSVPAVSAGRRGRARPRDSAGGQCSARNRLQKSLRYRDVPSMIGFRDYRVGCH